MERRPGTPRDGHAVHRGVVQFIGVAVVMLPRIPTFWIRVSGPQGDTIQKAENLIPETAEVIVSSPVMGHFSGRQWVFALDPPRPGLPDRAP